MAAVLEHGNSRRAQVRRVRTKFWPDELVQFSWLVDTIRQLKYRRLADQRSAVDLDRRGPVMV